MAEEGETALFSGPVVPSKNGTPAKCCNCPWQHALSAGMAQFYLTEKNIPQAKIIAGQMISADPKNPLGRQLLDFIKRRE